MRTRAGLARGGAGAFVGALVIAAIVLRGQSPGAKPSYTAAACAPALVNAGSGDTFSALFYGGIQRAVTKLHLKKTRVYQLPFNHIPIAQGSGRLGLAAQHNPCLVVVTPSISTQLLTVVAKRYPNVHFALADANTLNARNFVSLPNVANLVMRREDAGYLVGYLAGLMEKMHVGHATHGAIGVMGGMPEAGVDTYVDGYQQGAQAAYPGIKVLRVYAGSFFNDGRGAKIGLSQIKSGADILFGVAGDEGLGYLDAARERGVYGIGVDADQSYLGQYVLTSALIHLDNAVYAETAAAVHHHFTGGLHEFGLAEGGAGFAKPSKIVPASIVTMVEAQARKIARGEIIVGS